MDDIISVTFYDKDTGAILYTLNTNDIDSLDTLYTGPYIIGDWYVGEYYIDTKTKRPLERPHMPCETLQEVSVPCGEHTHIKGIPEGATCTLNGDTFTMDDSGVLEYMSSIPFKDTLHIELFPYVPVDITVEVRAD